MKVKKKLVINRLKTKKPYDSFIFTEKTISPTQM